MHAPHHVNDHHRVSHTEPQCERGIAAKVFRDAGDSERDGSKTHERDDLVHDESGRDMVADQRGYPVADPQMKGAVRRCGVAPVVRHLQQVRARVDGSAFRVRVESIAHHRALHQVGVHIARHERRSKNQRSCPCPQCRVNNLLPTFATQQYPCGYQQEYTCCQCHVHETARVAIAQR